MASMFLAPAAVAGKVQVALAWNDMPGHPSATLQLVNDLDLLVWSQVQLSSARALFYGNGGAVAGARNNVKAVSTSCAAGSNVTVAVHGAIVLSPRQSYALVVSGSSTHTTFSATNSSQMIADAAAAARCVQVPLVCSVAAPALTTSQGLGTRAFPSRSPCAAARDSSRPIFASFAFKDKNRPPRGSCSGQSISLALAAGLRVSILACSVYDTSDDFVQVSPPLPPFPSPLLHAQQVRFACDVSIGADFYLAETRALDTFNFLLVSFPAMHGSSFACSLRLHRDACTGSGSVKEPCRRPQARARERLLGLLPLEQRGRRDVDPGP